MEMMPQPIIIEKKLYTINIKMVYVYLTLRLDHILWFYK